MSQMHEELDARHGGYRQWEFVYFVSAGVNKREKVTYVERTEYVSRSMEGYKNFVVIYIYFCLYC